MPEAVGRPTEKDEEAVCSGRDYGKSQRELLEVTNRCAGLRNGSGNSHGRRDVGIVVGYAGDSEWRGDCGNRAIAWVASTASAGKRMKVCWK
jgi:hypothetical protein